MKTPETDAYEYEFVNHDDCAGETLRRCHDGQDVAWDDNYNGPAVPSTLARKLERERDEARQVAAEWRSNAQNGWDGGHKDSFPWENTPD